MYILLHYSIVYVLYMIFYFLPCSLILFHLFIMNFDAARWRQDTSEYMVYIMYIRYHKCVSTTPLSLTHSLSDYFYPKLRTPP